MQAAQEGYIGGLNVITLLEEMMGERWKLHIVIDNQAAVQLLTTQGPTSWRTRHLRIQAFSIVQARRLGILLVHHINGEWELADLLTKAL